MPFSSAAPADPLISRTPQPAPLDLFLAEDLTGGQLPAEAITVRIRWFGLCVGYFLVNVLSPGASRPQLNAILTVGAVYALLDTFWSLRGRVFLGRVPLFISLMEAVFIGLLCHYDAGLESPFRFYYFLSLLVCAIRYSPSVTYSTLGLHAVSFAALASSRSEGGPILGHIALMLIFMTWVTWAGTALVSLLKSAAWRLSDLNRQLQENQALLETRIVDRTRELQQSQALLVQQEKQAAFGLLAAGIAHEVGNPLAAISALVQMMNRREHDQYTHERLWLVDEQLIRIQKTLRELVEFSRPSSATAATCDIYSVIDGALSIAKYYKRMKGKTIRTRYAEGIPSITLVRDRVLQVFLNLILNALDATEEGAGIEITTAVSGEKLAITFRDEGHGIEPAAQGRLFAPYFTTKRTGTGLGLFVCRNILTECGGRIELVESSPHGTMFRVILTGPELAGCPDLEPPEPEEAATAIGTPAPKAPADRDGAPLSATLGAAPLGS
jgi:two-component system NtrC family sensor kinase